MVVNVVTALGNPLFLFLIQFDCHYLIPVGYLDFSLC